MPLSAEDAGRRLTLCLGLLLGAAFAAGAKGPELQTVSVRPGDTLWSIAQRYLEDPQRWNELLKYNQQLSSDPTVALPGTSLKVPVSLIKPAFKVAKLTYVQGRVSYRAAAGGDWRPAELHMPLYPGDVLRTEEWSSARIKFPHGSVLNLYSKSLVVVKPDGPQSPDLKLVKGTLRALHLKLNAGSAVIAPKRRDTVYEATANDGVAAKVQVFSGSADVSSEAGAVTLVGGQEVEVPEGSGPGRPRAIAEDSASPDKIEALRHYQARKSAGPVTTELGVFKLDIEEVKPGVPLAGMRIQLSRTPDFRKVLFDQMFEPDEKVSLREAGTVAGAYWWRAAPVDLLGNTGKFSEPKRAVIQ